MSDTEDTSAVLLERRWFAAFKAASRARAECEELLDAIDASERAWNQARVRLAELEMLRDRLGEQLSGVHDADQDFTSLHAEVMPAA